LRYPPHFRRVGRTGSGSEKKSTAGNRTQKLNKPAINNNQTNSIKIKETQTKAKTKPSAYTCKLKNPKSKNHRTAGIDRVGRARVVNVAGEEGARRRYRAGRWKLYESNAVNDRRNKTHGG
jgi:hypothetical protein